VIAIRQLPGTTCH